MAEYYSTALRNYLLGCGSFRQAFEDSAIKLYSGTPPANADAAVTGTLLCTFYKSSGATLLVPSFGEIVKVLVTSHAAAETWGFTCTSTLDGAVVTAVYTNTPDAGGVADVAVRLVKLFQDIGLKACATGQDGYVYVETHHNQSLTIALTGGMTGTVTITDAQYATDTNNLLRFGLPASGAIAKDSGQTWSGLAVATGTAGYYRLVRVGSNYSMMDDGTLDTTTQLRVQGVCGVGSGEFQMSSVSIVSGATYTIDGYTTTFPASA